MRFYDYIGKIIAKCLIRYYDKVYVSKFRHMWGHRTTQTVLHQTTLYLFGSYELPRRKWFTR